MPRVTLYTRDGCHLCEEALEILAQARGTHEFVLEVVDIDNDLTVGDDRRATYSDQIPVVEIDGRKVFKYRVDLDRLARLLPVS